MGPGAQGSAGPLPPFGVAGSNNPLPTPSELVAALHRQSPTSAS